MEDIKFRRFQYGDETEIMNLIHLTERTVNIKDYPVKVIDKLVEKVDENFVLKRAQSFHMYVLLDNDKIIGVGAIGPYWDSLTEFALFNIFILPEYQGKGLGRKLIEILEADEYFKQTDRVEIASSQSGLNFYRHLGYGFKKFGNILDKSGCYRIEKYPKISKFNNDSKQYNMRKYLNNGYHQDYEFVYNIKKKCIKNPNEVVEEEQHKLYDDFIEEYQNDIYIIQLNGKDIGFYCGRISDDNTYEIIDLCLIPEYQDKGIDVQLLKDLLEMNSDKNINLQCMKQSQYTDLLTKLGFSIIEKDNQFCYMIKKKEHKQKQI